MRVVGRNRMPRAMNNTVRYCTKPPSSESPWQWKYVAGTAFALICLAPPDELKAAVTAARYREKYILPKEDMWDFPLQDDDWNEFDEIVGQDEVKHHVKVCVTNILSPRSEERPGFPMTTHRYI